MTATGNAADILCRVFSGSPSRGLAAGSRLFSLGDPVEAVFFVRRGRVDLIRHTVSGARLILHRAQPGQVLAEASVYSAAYHCDAEAAEQAEVAALPVSAFLHSLDDDPALARHWAASLARSLQGARLNAEIRAQRTVAERLDAWLESGHDLPPKGQWQRLAEVLGVSREALYRELAGRR